MAINSLMQLSGLLRPGFYGNPNRKSTMYGIPVGVKESMSYADAKRTYDLLLTFERFKLFRNATIDPGRRTLENDNELYYRVTIWENTKDVT
jgi:hypothetical protein